MVPFLKIISDSSLSGEHTAMNAHVSSQKPDNCWSNAPGEVTEGVVVDVGDVAKGQPVLGVVQQDRVLRGHGKHQAVG